MTSKTRGATAAFRPWTASEDSIVRARYGRVLARVIARDLGRTEKAVYKRGRRLGLNPRRRWTAADDAALRNLWGDTSLQGIARELGRTRITVYHRARVVLGMQAGCPDGMEYLSHAAKRTGFDCGQLRAILAKATVRVGLAMARPNRGRRRFHIVDPFEVDEAVASWCRTESLEMAARRTGIIAETLARILARFGENVPPRPGGKARWQIPMDVTNAAVTRWRATVTVKQAARRRRMPYARMWRWLQVVGAERLPGKPWRVSLQDARRAAAAARRRQGRKCRSWRPRAARRADAQPKDAAR